MSEPLLKVKDFLNKEKCNCGSIATWWYDPICEGKDKDQSYYCGTCVPKGCSCEWNFVSKDAYASSPFEENFLPEGIEGKDWKWVVRAKNGDCDEIKSGEIWIYLDGQGKEYPCSEFWYEKNGWDKYLEK